MPNNNPWGHNSFNIYKPEPAYGEITKNKELAQGAPMQGDNIMAPIRNLPKTAQRHAVSPPKPRRSAPKAPPGPPPLEVEMAQIYGEMAAWPGAGPLTQKYAQLAQTAATARSQR